MNLGVRKIIWILINCNKVSEADKIGRALLQKRLISCFDILPRIKAVYFWPPKSGKLEESKGAILVSETLPKNFNKIYKLTKQLHSDKLPFIGSMQIEVKDEYYQWVKGEIR